MSDVVVVTEEGDVVVVQEVAAADVVEVIGAGPAGPANTLSIGTVTGGIAAAASITGSSPAQVLNLVLPKGDPGDPCSLTIGTVTTTAAGTSASASITGTAPTQVLNLSIPRGDTGASGAGTGDILGPGATVTSGSLVVWNGSSGTAVGASALSGLVKLTAGVPSAAVAGTDFVLPSGNVATATALAAPYNLTIGSSSKSVNASNVTWTLGEIGAQPADADLTAIAALAGTSGLLRKTAADTWTLDTTNYLTSYTETDPVFVAHAAYGVTGTKIANWDTAYGWGNHASANYLAKSGGTMTGPINEAEGGAIAAAATVDLDAATGNFVHITGTTAITTITLAQGARRVVVFDGALTLTAGASLILPGGANITTAAGDTAEFWGEGAGVTRCVSYNRADGYAVVQASSSVMPNYAFFNASTTWVCPAGVTAVRAWLIGGGGGGADTDGTTPGGAGGKGAYVSQRVVVVPGTTYTITVGAGGSGSNSSSGQSGNDTVAFGVTARGGNGGTRGTSGGAAGADGTTSGTAFSPGATGVPFPCLGTRTYTAGTQTSAVVPSLNSSPGPGSNGVGETGGTSAGNATGGVGGCVYLEW